MNTPLLLQPIGTNSFLSPSTGLSAKGPTSEYTRTDDNSSVGFSDDEQDDDDVVGSGEGGKGGRGYQATLKQPRSFESLSYAEPDTAVFEAYNEKTASSRWKSVVRWVINFFTSIVIALVAILIGWAARNLSHLRFLLLDYVTSSGQNPDPSTPFSALSFISFVLVSVAFLFLAAVPVAYWAPHSGGSGIPEIKAVLNGVALPGVLSLRTLFCKVFGVIFSVASGLPVGQEGPMVHAGAIIGSLLSGTRWFAGQAFQNDAEQRTAISCGAAAGIAAAFSAPIGGTLFVIEEGVSFWHRSLTWKTFFAAVVTTWVVDWLASGVDNGSWGAVKPGVFGNFISSSVGWSLFELPFFLLVGALAGVLGAIFIALQSQLSKCRQKGPLEAYLQRPLFRVLEVLLIGALIVSAQVAVSVLMPICLSLPAQESSTASFALHQLYCAEGEFNFFASLNFSLSEDVIKLLFHSQLIFPLWPLGLFSALYMVSACIIYATSIPAGIFLPSLVGGAALGRLIGEVLRAYVPVASSVSPGVYALVGGAAMLGGVTRMTISLLCLVLEATGNLEYALPVISALFVTRFVGNWLNASIYDSQILSRGWPLLHDDLPPYLAKKLRVADVMAKPPIVVREIESAGVIFDVLRHSEHSSFPVTRTDSLRAQHPRLGSYAGTISRKDLSILLTNRSFHPSLPTVPFALSATTPAALSSAFTFSSTTTIPRAAAATTTAAAAASTSLPAASAAAATDLYGVNSGGNSSSHIPLQILRRPSFRRSRSMADETILVQQQQQQQQQGASLPPPSALDGEVSSPPSRTVALSAITSSSLTSSAVRICLPSFQEEHGFQQELRSAAANSASGAVALAQHDGLGGSVQSLVATEDIVEMIYTDEPLLPFEEFAKHYPKYPNVSNMRLSDSQRAMFVDLRPYSNLTAYSINAHAPLVRAFQLFRALGLKILPVTNDSNDCVGVLTRHDFQELHLSYCLRQKEGR